ncbi:MAG: 50S ribosomal protein L10 [Acidimicrobiales bacterium]
MDQPRPEKVAVVDEVRARLDGSTASVVTEYRGLTVSDLAELRRSLSAAGSEYKIFKNTLVKRAIDGSAHASLEDLLTGPTAIAFVHGEVSAVAKALRDYSRTNAHLVIKGGLFEGSMLTPAQLGELADLPSRDVLLARLAGGIQAPLAQLAGLLQALPRSFAYGLKALLDQRGGVPEPAAPETTESATAETEPAESATTEPATAETEPAETEPAEPATTEPATTESETAEPATTEPQTTESATAEPETTEPETTEPETGNE